MRAAPYVRDARRFLLVRHAAMTPYTAFDLPSGRPALPEPLDAAGLGGSEAALLTALFDADGASADALSERARVSREAVDDALGTLGQRGLVERDGDAAWLTGEAFGLRRAVRRAGARGAVRR